MLIWHSAKLVVHVFQTESCQITVHVEGVEMSLERGIFPLPFSRYADAAVMRFQSDSHEVEPILVLAEWLMIQDCLHSCLSVRIEHVHLLCSITFSYDRHVDLLFRCAVLQKVSVLWSLRIELTDHDV